MGTLESYAALLGILIGAGIFTVTSHAWTLTGPSVMLGYIVLFPMVLASSVLSAALCSVISVCSVVSFFLHQSEYGNT